MAEWEAEIAVDEALARRLIGGQFPELDAGELRWIGMGWDNSVWATADGIAFRFPRREIALAGVAREIAILPQLAQCLDVAIPDAAYIGRPVAQFPWPWFGSRLIPGRELAARPSLDGLAQSALAAALGAFLRGLHGLSIPAAETLPIDPMGRADMATRVPRTRTALDEARHVWEAPASVNRWLDEAERLPVPADAVLVHGDLNVRHLLVDDAAALSGVIDWGDVCRGDPSIDLTLYWSLFSAPARAAFRDAYGPIDDARLLRARVLALFMCALLAPYARAEGMVELEREAVRGLERTILD